MDQYQCRGKLLKNFQDHWSIRISPGKGMDQWLVHMNFPRKRYGPMALKVLWKFRSWPVLVHRVLFPVQREETLPPREKRFMNQRFVCFSPSHGLLHCATCKNPETCLRLTDILYERPFAHRPWSSSPDPIPGTYVPSLLKGTWART